MSKQNTGKGEYLQVHWHFGSWTGGINPCSDGDAQTEGEKAGEQ